MALLNRFAPLLFVMMAISLSLNGQQFEKQRVAFKTSYSQEKTGDYSGALNSIKAVYDENSYEINLRLGWLSYKSGDFKASEGFYRKAVSLRSYAIEARFGLVFPLSSMGNWDQVIQIYKEILTIDPVNSVANYRFGLLYYGRQEYGKSEELFTKVVNLYPFDYDGLIMLGWTKLKLGKMIEAKSLFQKALLYSPDDPSALEGLSLIR